MPLSQPSLSVFLWSFYIPLSVLFHFWSFVYVGSCQFLAVLSGAAVIAFISTSIFFCSSSLYVSDFLLNIYSSDHVRLPHTLQLMKIYFFLLYSFTSYGIILPFSSSCPDLRSPVLHIFFPSIHVTVIHRRIECCCCCKGF